MQVIEEIKTVDPSNTESTIHKKSNPVSNSSPVTIEVFNTEEVFQKLQGDWNKLATKADTPIYVTREWISCWWKHFGRHPKRNPFVIALYKNDTLIGLAPLYKGRSAIGSIDFQVRLHMMGCGVGKQEFLGFHDEYGRSDFLDIIADPDHEEEVANKLLSFLLKPELEVDTLSLQHLRDNSFVKRKLQPLLDDKDIDYDLEQTDICPYITLREPDTMEEYLKQLSSNTRRRLRQTLRAIGEEDGYKTKQVDSSETLQEELEKLREMHQSRWNGFGYPGAFFDTRFDHFLKEFVEEVYDQGWVWFKQAIDKDGYAATRLALKFNNRFYDYMSGFDASCPSSKYRPGIGLLTLMIKDSIEKGNAEIVELLRGDERYKFDMTSKVQKNWRLSLPLRTKRSPARKILSKILQIGTSFHAIISREWTLMKVQKKLKGTPLMVINYIKTRYSMLKYKYQQN